MSQQCTVEAFPDKTFITLAPNVSLAMAVRFNQPELFGTTLDAFLVPQEDPNLHGLKKTEDSEGT